MRVELLSLETLSSIPSFEFQNDSFKRWCEEHQDESFIVTDVYSDHTLRLKGYNFVIILNYTNYRAKVVKQLRDETGYAMMDCKRAFDHCEWDYNKTREELRSWGPPGFIGNRY